MIVSSVFEHLFGVYSAVYGGVKRKRKKNEARRFYRTRVSRSYSVEFSCLYVGGIHYVVCRHRNRQGYDRNSQRVG
jgi:hypothetical protein